MLQPSKQRMLYCKLKDLSLAEDVREYRLGGQVTYQIEFQTRPVVAHMCWPSGRPCLAANMYLLEKSSSSTGDSVVTAASNLSALIRYCASGRDDRMPISFRELKDSDIFQMIKRLTSDTRVDAPGVRLRDNNTARTIMHTTFDFLTWYQNNLIVDGHKLIGEEKKAAIRIRVKQNARTKSAYLDHRHLPPRVEKDPKLPIDTSMVEAIDAAIDHLELPENAPAPALRRFGGNDEFLRKYFSYKSARRNFMVFMMRTTGLRPEEMSRMSVTSNNKSVRADKAFFILPTMKRRSLNPPLRNFPIERWQSLRAILYLEARKEWLNYCASREGKAIETDAMFLSVGMTNLGHAVGKDALQKDFKVLCNHAGFRNQQVCFSMFRHRFITDLVTWHLMTSDRQKDNMYDYRTMLEKVREKTGHKSIDSLWHYIDLARDMSGAWDGVNKIIKLNQDAERLNYEVREIHKLSSNRALGGMTSDQIINRLKESTANFLKSSRNPIVDKIIEKNRR